MKTITKIEKARKLSDDELTDLENETLERLQHLKSLRSEAAAVVRSGGDYKDPHWWAGLNTRIMKLGIQHQLLLKVRGERRKDERERISRETEWLRL